MAVSCCAGGAWTIGYKAWGSLLGRRLSKHGVLVYCLDYRNFPQVCSCAHDRARPVQACIYVAIKGGSAMCVVI